MRDEAQNDHAHACMRGTRTYARGVTVLKRVTRRTEPVHRRGTQHPATGNTRSTRQQQHHAQTHGDIAAALARAITSTHVSRIRDSLRAARERAQRPLRVQDSNVSLLVIERGVAASLGPSFCALSCTCAKPQACHVPVQSSSAVGMQPLLSGRVSPPLAAVRATLEGRTIGDGEKRTSNHGS